MVCVSRLETGADGKKQVTPIRPIAVLAAEVDVEEANIKLM